MVSAIASLLARATRNGACVSLEDMSLIYTVITRTEVPEKDLVAVHATVCLLTIAFVYNWSFRGFFLEYAQNFGGVCGLAF